VTYALIVANVVAFGIEVAAGTDINKPTAQQLLHVGGNFAPLTKGGEPWRLITAMFLHAGLLHIGMNMLCLAQARVVEQLFGRIPMIAIYLTSGLLGGVVSMTRNPNVVSVGASGAVFGLYGAFGAYLVFRKTAIAEAAWSKTTRQIATFVGINLVYGLVTPGIDMSAHIGGIVVGFVVATALLAGKHADRQRVSRGLGLLAAGLAVTAVATFAIRPPVDVTPELEAFEKVESICITRWNEIITGAKAGTVTNAQAIEQIERDVLPPWKALRARVFAIEHPPERLATLWSALKSYLVSRQEAWESYVAMVRGGGADTSKLDEYKRKEETSRSDAEAVKREIERLSKS
jgi:rhomboid protease GluP